MPKSTRRSPREPRYILEERQEENAVRKVVPIYYIKDMKKGKHGEYVARFYRETEARWSLETLNKRKK